MGWPKLIAGTALEMVAKIPFERVLFRPPDNKKRIEELQTILGKARAKPSTDEIEAPEAIKEKEPPPLGNLGNQRPRVHLEAPPANGVSTEETVAYQNREIAKNLVVLEKHFAQRLTIAGKKCDCGAGRHLLAIESLAEETISMVDNPEIYYRLIDWVREVSPKSTDQAAKSGQFDEEYPVFSRHARDFRKELIGSLEPAALINKKEEPVVEEVE